MLGTRGPICTDKSIDVRHYKSFRGETFDQSNERVVFFYLLERVCVAH